jgi:hypothetical protein
MTTLPLTDLRKWIEENKFVTFNPEYPLISAEDLLNYLNEFESEPMSKDDEILSRHPYLKKEDLEFAVGFQSIDRLDAVKWLRDKIKEHNITPLKTAKDILDKYYLYL